MQRKGSVGKTEIGTTCKGSNSWFTKNIKIKSGTGT